MRYCPHCLETLPDDEPGGEPITHCPRCTAALDPNSAEPAPPREYKVGDVSRSTDPNADIKEYVQSLEKRARQERKRKPYSRNKAPVGLITGFIFIALGIAALLHAFFEGGYMSGLINGILLSSVFILMGVVCLVVRDK